MSDIAPQTDRRTFPRFSGDSLEVALRRRGRIGHLGAKVIDFNRFGIAVLTARPLPKDQEVFITLHCGDARIENVVGVVHTCFSWVDVFRCGIQFRTTSRLQFDKEQVEAALLRMEMGFVSPPEISAAKTSAPH